MKILWITNTIFPYPREYLNLENNPYGGWLLGLYNYIKNEKNIELAISTVYDGKELLTIKDNFTIYYLLPKNKDLKESFKRINEDFKPDLVHIHGTEFNYGNEFQKANPDIKSIVSIQGLVSVISDFYLANIQKRDIGITVRDLIKGNVFKQQKDYKKRGIVERDTLIKSNCIIGRTTWDYAHSYYLTNEFKYYKCNESLRDIFYITNWNIEKVERHSIYISQTKYPLKGFHVVLKAINLLKNKYCNIKLYVAGNNILDKSTLKNILKTSGYSKMLSKLIKQYNLENNIVFVGTLNEQQVANTLKKSHIFVQASSIENSPNSLGEAMLIGMPCVASYVGGTMDMLKDKEEGYLYPFGDYGLLAYYIDQLFSNDEEAIKLGNNAKKHALVTHDREQNAKRMIEIYKKMANKT